jgi:hypothetical protein
MITLGITWHNKVYMELVCDCTTCSQHHYKKKERYTNNSFQECYEMARETGWLVLRTKKLCYAPNHHRFQRKKGT